VRCASPRREIGEDQCVYVGAVAAPFGGLEQRDRAFKKGVATRSGGKGLARHRKLGYYLLPMHEPTAQRRTDRIRAFAREVGFDAVAIARADVPLEEDFRRYESFVEAGRVGEMKWLAENREARRALNTELILKSAKSVICLARKYQRSEVEEGADPPFAQTIARYARGRDYHTGVRRKLRQLAAFVRRLAAEGGESATARPMCDDAPILERAWAARAGLGFVGKNGLLIVPGEGSMVLLGEVVTTMDLIADSPIPERCGTCTRCLDVCPTRAFEAPFVLDPRKCVSYLTIEHHSGIPVELREGIGEHLFGCDDCQTVCPFNASRKRPGLRTGLFEPHERWASTELIDLLSLTSEQWDPFREGSPIGRATREGLARNAAMVLGNRKDRKARPALANAATHHDSPEVREAAQWALQQIDHDVREE